MTLTQLNSEHIVSMYASDCETCFVSLINITQTLRLFGSGLHKIGPRYEWKPSVWNRNGTTCMIWFGYVWRVGRNSCWLQSHIQWSTVADWGLEKQLIWGLYPEGRSRRTWARVDLMRTTGQSYDFAYIIYCYGVFRACVLWLPFVLWAASRSGYH